MPPNKSKNLESSHSFEASRVILKHRHSWAKRKLKTGNCNNLCARKVGWHMHHNNPQRPKIPSQLIQQLDTYWEGEWLDNCCNIEDDKTDCQTPKLSKAWWQLWTFSTLKHALVLTDHFDLQMVKEIYQTQQACQHHNSVCCTWFWKDSLCCYTFRTSSFPQASFA